MSTIGTKLAFRDALLTIRNGAKFSLVNAFLRHIMCNAVRDCVELRIACASARC